MAAGNANVSTFRKIMYRIVPLAQAGSDQIQVSTLRQIYANASSTPNTPANGRQGVSTMRKVYAVQQAAIVTPLPLMINNVIANPTTGIAKVTVIDFAAAVSGGVPFTVGSKYKYQWNWSNGTNTTASGGISPGITFQFPGIWTGTVTVTDSVGSQVTASTPTIQITGATVIIIAGTPASGAPVYQFTINGTSFDASGNPIGNETVYLFQSINGGAFALIQTGTTGRLGGGAGGKFTFIVQITTTGNFTFEVSDTNPPS